MKKVKTIPTILALFILLLGIIAGVVLIKSGFGISTKAKLEITPKQVKITNISENSFTVSWVTDEQTNCFLKYGTKGEISFTASDERDELSGKQENFFTHYVTPKNLKPATDYFFKINCGGKLFDNNGQPYQVKTASSPQGAMPPNDIAYGVVLKQDGSSAAGVIVYLSLANAAPLSSLTKASGSWVIPLNFARSPDLSSWAVYDREASIEEIFVQGGPEGTATAVAVTKYDSPMPAITLGGNFDFRQPPPQPTPTVEQQTTSNSRFSVEEITTPSASLEIISPSPGESVNTLKPEILGTGPAGETLTITIHSSETLTSKITINNDGRWSWIPPQELSPGEHTVIVSLADGRKVTHTFTVLAAGESELPSFTASPSATVTPTPTSITIPTPLLTSTPTSTFTPTPITRVSVPSTEGGVPRPGNLTPTFLFFIMGVSLLFLGIIWKKLPI